MELHPRKSIFQLLLILLSFGWASFALWQTSVALLAQLLLMLLIAVLVYFSLHIWMAIPIRISLRNEILHLHYSGDEMRAVPLGSGSPHLFWIKFSDGLMCQSIFLYRDSFSSVEWAALQRGVRREKGS